MKTSTKPETHLFIIWDAARSKAKEILEDLEKNFEVLDVYDICWTLRYFSENLTRFYGTNLPAGSSKEQHIGKGPFVLVIVRDHETNYNDHETSKGVKTINSRTFLSKSKHRDWTGGGHRIHGTNTPEETKHDLKLLLGDLADKYFSHNYTRSSKQPIVLTKDLEGAKGWNNMSHLLDTLNYCLPYVVMRNFDMLPNEYYAKDHGDVDLLVSSIEEARYVTNSTRVFNEDYRVHHKTSMNGEDVYFDFRYIGDNYYDENWERDIIQNRELDEKGFYKPSSLDHAASLFYHAYIHKPSVRNDYLEALNKLVPVREHSIEVYVDWLAKYMKSRHYLITQPVDLTVGLHPPHYDRLDSLL